MLYRNIITTFVSLAVIMMCAGCVEHLEETVYLPADYVSFKVSLGGNEDALKTRGIAGSLGFEDEEWVVETDASTKAELSSYLEGKAGVYGYLFRGEWNPTTCEPLKDMEQSPCNFDGDQMDAETPVKWSSVDKDAAVGDKFRVFVYAPFDAAVPIYETPGKPAAEGAPEVRPKGAPVIHIDDVLKKDGDVYVYQKDIIVADAEVVIEDKKAHRKEIPLDFEHIYTAIEFKAGFVGCTIKRIDITGVNVGGDYVIGTGWENPVSGNMTLNPDETVLVIPQEISEGADITVTYTAAGVENSVTTSLSGVKWRQGRNITYTLKNEQNYIYLDLAAGNVTIENNDYTGWVYVDGVKKEISGTRVGKQEYYIYQSCVTNVNNKEDAINGKRNYKVGWSGYDSTNKKGTGVHTLPSYPLVMYNGQLWSDYITNNTDVEAVIRAWDNEAGAGRATASSSNVAANNTGAEGAVRNAGREATKNRIHITGNIGDVKMIIDNIYSSFQERGSTPVRKRTQGGISFLPDQGKNSDSNLTIHIIGDNRLGCVNYQNWTYPEKNSLVFEGSGSLTVGDTDYYRDGSGLGSNRSCSVIGGKDEEETEEDVYNIIFKSGVIYAGATPSTCTAIGGGGNGDTSIVIDGGTITAVAKTTGTAIGGGTGLVQPGGKGNVTITGGNVYAYNFANNSNIPAAAIGAAGSQTAVGGEGVVTITGGYVYAESGNGTAIGGGSSQQRYGGKGIVTITGGTVIAKSKTRGNVGIGGGSSYTGSYGRKSGETKNGGDAVITISGTNTVIRTGSIGGGTPGKGADEGGKIGSAQITVEGGDIQAQFVMADSPSNSFIMTDGVIRNSETSDSEYFCIQENGGAVYMEKGSFEMRGGTIKECSADVKPDARGGAVYILGDDNTTFIMSGGEILGCKAMSDGGAVYLEGGTVNITGGKIEGNVAYNGNGGAVSIKGGSFTMDGAGVSIAENAAFGSVTNGNGGGIYVAPASQTSESNISVNLIKGSIVSNSSERNGGGVCVDMGKSDKAQLNVSVGSVVTSDAKRNPLINSNTASVKGGGMYVNGANASVVLNYGQILHNSTSSYQVNPDIYVEGGLVTLMGSGITTQATITFNNNAMYYTQGNVDDVPEEQYVVSASKSKLKARSDLNQDGFALIDAYYDTFVGWNTRRDGKGQSYTDAEVTTIEEDITLYARWE